MRKLAFCLCENKDADQLNREADQHLCFRYTDSTIPLLPKSEISSLQPSSVVLQAGLCRAWSETPKTTYLTTRLKWQTDFQVISLIQSLTSSYDGNIQIYKKEFSHIYSRVNKYYGVLNIFGVYIGVRLFYRVKTLQRNKRYQNDLKFSKRQALPYCAYPDQTAPLGAV